jgi:single-strand DNA-binding protein
VNEIYVTVSGRLVADPEARNTKTGGVPFAAFRVASTARRVNRETGEFEDAATNFVNVTAFRSLGANVANSLHKGDPVVVHGRMRVNQWMRQDNTPATTVEIDAYSVGHDLSYGTSTFAKVSRPQVDRSDRMSDENVQAAHARAAGEPEFDAENDDYVVQDEESFGEASQALVTA